ncbi:serine--tRNA ligase [Candidatus Peribacteria bacterium RIFCSPHIGHO2_01_FULL_51_9]|nr:MAG: serine--tRNA ligase [Candidatus Peribacteria bacterium RIFCSPHIGHO2_01_FULL_51_9]
MIDLDDLRARPKDYQKAAKNKGIDVSIDGFLTLDARRREITKRVEEGRARKNSVSKRIPTMQDAEKKVALAEMKTLAEELKTQEEDLKRTEDAWWEMQLMLPTIPLEGTPIGKDESGNVEIERWGDVPAFGFDPRDHVSLGEALDIIDIPRGVKVSGARSYFLKGDGARLHHAVMRFTLDQLTKRGWTLFVPPLLTFSECLMGTGFFPGAEEQVFAIGAKKGVSAQINDDNLYLIGTSEVTVCSYHKDEVLLESELPKKYAGYSACFRREAGTYGKDTKGLYRVHQFEKVEQVVLCQSDQGESLKMFEEIRLNAQAVLQALGLPYRIMNVCTGDMGKGKVVMHDIETWMPSRKAYGETHSCSYLGDFQARRLNIRYETKDGKKKFVHTLNNTCIASPRILIPILEIYQNKDGTVTIPEVLRPYMGGQEKIEKR